MRVVLDTNILARATPGKAGPAAALRQAVRNPHLLVISPYLLTELSRVLRYDRVRQLHGLSDTEIDDYLIAIQANAMIVNVAAQSPAVVPSDPDDDPIVATAVDGNADYLSTLDRHLHRPEVKSYCISHGVRIVTDVELLSILQP